MKVRNIQEKHYFSPSQLVPTSSNIVRPGQFGCPQLWLVHSYELLELRLSHYWSRALTAPFKMSLQFMNQSGSVSACVWRSTLSIGLKLITKLLTYALHAIAKGILARLASRLSLRSTQQDW